MKKILFPTLFWSVLFLVMAIVPYSVPHLRGISTNDIHKDGLDAALPFVFGGRILAVTSCSCSGGLRLEIGPPRPMDLLFQPGRSLLFSMYTLLPSEYVLGTYTPGGVCEALEEASCFPIPVAGTVTIVGTTLLPFGGVF